jgi:hypothetical protein
MDFSDTYSEWQPIPKWTRFLISLGYGWHRGGPQTRRIALISMPCDSAAAGLILLGAMIRDLEVKEANELDRHTMRLVEHARQYVEHCRRCTLPVCDPLLRGCGQISKVNGSFRSTKPQYQSVKYSITKMGKDPDCPIWLLPNFKYAGGNMCPLIEELGEFFIDGDSPSQLHFSTSGLSPELYEQLVPGTVILPDNLKRSYSALCLAGRAIGESATREMCASMRFRSGSKEHGLGELLTIQDWSVAKVSRVAFFNTRTEELDRKAATPHLVVADGDASFLKVVDHSEFQRSDVVGVIHRTMERDKLETVGIKMQPSQWYAADTDRLCELPPLPRGISVAILRRRTP